MKKIHYSWVTFAACALLAFTVVGLCQNTRPLFLAPVSTGLGVTRSRLSTVFMISGLMGAACSLFIGPIRKKFTLRQLVLFGVSCMVVANVLYALCNSLLTYTIGEALFGLGTGFSSMTVIALIIRAWFAGRHGTILGCLYMATGLGSIVLAPQMGKLIEGSGYRSAYWVTAAVMAVMLVLAFVLIRNDPKDKGLEPMFAGDAKIQTASGEKTGLTLKEAMRTPKFYIMCLLGLMLGGGVNALQGTYGAYIGTDLGYGTVYVAEVVSFLYVINTICKIPLGMLIDKIGVRRVINICCVALAGGAVSLIIMSKGTNTAYVFAVCHGLGNILFTVPSPLVAPAIFGTKDVTAMTGIFMACMSLGSAAFSPLSNLVYDISGSYVPLYIGMVVMFAVAVVINTIIVRPAWKKASAA